MPDGRDERGQFVKGTNLWVGKSHSAESKQKMSLSAKGRIPWMAGKHHSLETREKLKEASMGNKNALGYRFSLEARKKMSENHKGKFLSEEHRKKISEANKGKSSYWKGKKRFPLSEETKLKISNSQKGKIITNETKKRISDSLMGRFGGDKNPNWGKRGEETSGWKGGVTQKNQGFRNVIENLFECKYWHKSVLLKDNFTCQGCGQLRGNIVVHH
jgi:hypothetical protein